MCLENSEHFADIAIAGPWFSPVRSTVQHAALSFALFFPSYAARKAALRPDRQQPDTP